MKLGRWKAVSLIYWQEANLRHTHIHTNLQNVGYISQLDQVNYPCSFLRPGKKGNAIVTWMFVKRVYLGDMGGLAPYWSGQGVWAKCNRIILLIRAHLYHLLNLVATISFLRRLHRRKLSYYKKIFMNISESFISIVKCFILRATHSMCVQYLRR